MLLIRNYFSFAFLKWRSRKIWCIVLYNVKSFTLLLHVLFILVFLLAALSVYFFYNKTQIKNMKILATHPCGMGGSMLFCSVALTFNFRF